MRYRQNGEDGVITISPTDTTPADLRSRLAETRAALINSDKRMKALEHKIQEASALLNEQLTLTAKSQEDAQKAIEAQQFTQTMLLSFIAFTASAGLFLNYFKDR